MCGSAIIIYSHIIHCSRGLFQPHQSYLWHCIRVLHRSDVPHHVRGFAVWIFVGGWRYVSTLRWLLLYLWICHLLFTVLGIRNLLHCLHKSISSYWWTGLRRRSTMNPFSPFPLVGTFERTHKLDSIKTSRIYYADRLIHVLEISLQRVCMQTTY